MNELMMTTGLANYSNTSVSAGPLQGGISGGCPRCGNSEAKYSVFDVANWFLTHEAMTHKKLQKMCYYAQVWFYALKNQRFMNTEFQAWVHGPVSPVLYVCFKSFGVEKIKIKGTLFEMLSTVSRQDTLNRYLIYHGSGNDQCFMGGQATPMITASVVVATEAGDCEYSLKRRHDPDDDRLVTDEAVWRVLPTQNPVDTALAEKILQRLNGCYGGFWVDCFVFHFCSSAAEANANKRWDIGNSARLRPDGGNLASVLLAIRQNDLRRYHYIVRQIQRVVPDFGDFVQKDEYGKVLLRWKHRCSDQEIGPNLTADGTLRLFF